MKRKNPTLEGFLDFWLRYDRKHREKAYSGAIEIAGKYGVGMTPVRRWFADEDAMELKRAKGIRLSPMEQPHDREELFKKFDAQVNKHRCIPGWTLLSNEVHISEASRKKVLAGNALAKKRDVIEAYLNWLPSGSPQAEYANEAMPQTAEHVEQRRRSGGLRQVSLALQYVPAHYGRRIRADMEAPA